MAKEPSAWPAEAVVARPDRLTSSPRSTLSGLANPAKRGAALNPGNGQSLDMTPLVKVIGELGAQPATAWLNSPVSTWMSALFFRPGQVFRLLASPYSALRRRPAARL
jgi:hypothetical protein